MKNSKFINTLNSIVNFSGDKERQVEFAYNEMFKTYFSDISISNPYKCDGYFEADIPKGDKSVKSRIICEYKYDYDMKNKTIRSKVLCQVLFYLKKFERDGKPFPNIIFVGDVNECFVVHSNDLLKWLDFEGVDWSIAASCAAEKNPSLVLALANDDSRNAFVFDVDENFDFSEVYQKICDYSTNVSRLIRITEHNVDKVFNVFCKTVKDIKKISPNDLVAVFFGCMTDSENYYLHPKKKGVLVTPRANYRVDDSLFKGLMTHFASEYSPKEKARLASISDRLIEDTKRRKNGAFFTPTKWVNYGHKMVSEVLGENWKDEYTVIDCCCGTKNLTRDYNFANLYLSTLEQAELDISKQYNQEAKACFAFDFLNGSDDEFFAKAGDLKDAFIQNKKICFLINPPYGSCSGVGKISKGAINTNIRELMQNEKIEGSEFIKQFLWRITDLKRKFNCTNLCIAAFTNPSWLIKDKSKNFRKTVSRQF